MAKSVLTSDGLRKDSSAYTELYDKGGLQVYLLKGGRFEVKCGHTHTYAHSIQEVSDQIDALALSQFASSGQEVLANINEKLGQQYRLELKASKKIGGEGEEQVFSVEGSMGHIADKMTGTTNLNIPDMVPGRRYAMQSNMYGGEYAILVPLNMGMLPELSPTAEAPMYEKQPFSKGMVLEGIDPVMGNLFSCVVADAFPNGSFTDSIGKVYSSDDAELYQFCVKQPSVTEENFKEPDEPMYESENIPSYNPVGVVKDTAPMAYDLANYDAILSASAGVLHDFMKTAKKVAYLDRSSLNKVTVTAVNDQGQATDGEIEWNVRIGSPHYKRSSQIMIPLTMVKGNVDIGKEFIISTGQRLPLTVEGLQAHLGTLAQDDLYRKAAKETNDRFPSTVKADKDIDNLLNGVEKTSAKGENETFGLDGGDKLHYSVRPHGIQVTYEVGSGKHSGQLVDIAMTKDQDLADKVFEAAKSALYETSFLKGDARLKDAYEQIRNLQSRFGVSASKKTAGDTINLQMRLREKMSELGYKDMMEYRLEVPRMQKGVVELWLRPIDNELTKKDYDVLTKELGSEFNSKYNENKSCLEVFSKPQTASKKTAGGESYGDVMMQQEAIESSKTPEEAVQKLKDMGYVSTFTEDMNSDKVETIEECVDRVWSLYKDPGNAEVLNASKKPLTKKEIEDAVKMDDWVTVSTQPSDPWAEYNIPEIIGVITSESPTEVTVEIDPDTRYTVEKSRAKKFDFNENTPVEASKKTAGNLEEKSVEELEALIDNWMAAASEMTDKSPQLTYVTQRIKEAEAMLQSKKKEAVAARKTAAIDPQAVYEVFVGMYGGTKEHLEETIGNASDYYEITEEEFNEPLPEGSEPTYKGYRLVSGEYLPQLLAQIEADPNTGDDITVICKDNPDERYDDWREVRNLLGKQAAKKTVGGEYQPKTGVPCSCKPGVQRDNCPACEGTGMRIDFQKIRDSNNPAKKTVVSAFSHDGKYVTVKEDGNQNLVITLTEEGKQELADLLGAEKDHNEYTIFAELLSDVFGNSGMDFVNPEDIGALTDSIIIGEDVATDDRGNVTDTGKVWWYPNYQIKSPVQDLMDNDSVTFASGDVSDEPKGSDVEAAKKTSGLPSGQAEGDYNEETGEMSLHDRSGGWISPELSPPAAYAVAKKYFGSWDEFKKEYGVTKMRPLDFTDKYFIIIGGKGASSQLNDAISDIFTEDVSETMREKDFSEKEIEEFVGNQLWNGKAKTDYDGLENALIEKLWTELIGTEDPEQVGAKVEALDQDDKGQLVMEEAMDLMWSGFYSADIPKKGGTPDYSSEPEGDSSAIKSGAKKTAFPSLRQNQVRMLADTFVNNLLMYTEEVAAGDFTFADRAKEILDESAFAGFPKFSESNRKQVEDIVRHGLVVGGVSEDVITEVLNVLAEAYGRLNTGKGAAVKTADTSPESLAASITRGDTYALLQVTEANRAQVTEALSKMGHAPEKVEQMLAPKGDAVVASDGGAWMGPLKIFKDYSPEGEAYSVYVNGEYKGIYLADDPTLVELGGPDWESKVTEGENAPTASKKTAHDTKNPDVYIVSEADIHPDMSDELAYFWNEYPNNKVMEGGYYKGAWNIFVENDHVHIVATDQAIADDIKSKLASGELTTDNALSITDTDTKMIERWKKLVSSKKTLAKRLTDEMCSFLDHYQGRDLIQSTARFREKFGLTEKEASDLIQAWETNDIEASKKTADAGGNVLKDAIMNNKTQEEAVATLKEQGYVSEFVPNGQEQAETLEEMVARLWDNYKDVYDPAKPDNKAGAIMDKELAEYVEKVKGAYKAHVNDKPDYYIDDNGEAIESEKGATTAVIVLDTLRNSQGNDYLRDRIDSAIKEELTPEEMQALEDDVFDTGDYDQDISDLLSKVDSGLGIDYQPDLGEAWVVYRKDLEGGNDTTTEASKKTATYYVSDERTGGEKETTFEDFSYFAREFGSTFMDAKGEMISKETALKNLNNVSTAYNPQGVAIARTDKWDRYKASKKTAEMFPPDAHQLRILKDTVRNPLKGQFLGGPTAEEAEQTLKSKFHFTDEQINKLKASKKTATGEMSADEVTEESYPIHFYIAKALGGEVKPFDQYQGPYIQVGGNKIWIQDATEYLFMDADDSWVGGFASKKDALAAAKEAHPEMSDAKLDRMVDEESNGIIAAYVEGKGQTAPYPLYKPEAIGNYDLMVNELRGILGVEASKKTAEKFSGGFEGCVKHFMEKSDFKPKHAGDTKREAAEKLCAYIKNEKYGSLMELQAAISVYCEDNNIDYPMFAPVPKCLCSCIVPEQKNVASKKTAVTSNQFDERGNLLCPSCGGVVDEDSEWLGEDKEGTGQHEYTGGDCTNCGSYVRRAKPSVLKM